MPCSMPADDGEAANANGAFASHHPGGGHFLFADGHVEFITDDIDLDTYQNFSTIAGTPTGSRSERRQALQELQGLIRGRRSDSDVMSNAGLYCAVRYLPARCVADC